jgi:transcriptional regulator with XRE-family HTH domain
MASARERGRIHDGEVGSRVRQRREELGLKQWEVCEHLAKLDIPMNDSQLSQLERGGAGLDSAKLVAFAAVLDCSVTYLLGGTKDPNGWVPDQTAEEWATRVYLTPHLLHNLASVG